MAGNENCTTEPTIADEKKQMDEEFLEEISAGSIAAQQRRRIEIRKSVGEDFGVSITRFGLSFYVTEVLQGTKAYEGGICVGDRIDCVNEETVQGSERFFSADILELLKNSPELRIMIAEKPVTRLWRVHQDATVQRAVRMDKDLGRPIIHLAASEAMNEMSPGLTIFEVNYNNVLHLRDDDVTKTMTRALDKEGCVDVSFVPRVFGAEVLRVRTARRNNRYHPVLANVSSGRTPDPTNQNQSLRGPSTLPSGQHNDDT
eukprot:CFRG1538T1